MKDKPDFSATEYCQFFVFQRKNILAVNGNSAITIRTISYELFCRIDIADEGIGISEDEHSKVFGRFYRSPMVSEQEGVGIGLFLAREIITSVGGYIKVTSNLKHGSLFSVFLPLDK